MMAEDKLQHMLPANLVPDFLKELPGWVVWRYEKGEGPKPRKVPYYTDGTRRRGVQGSPEDRRNLADFDTAFATYRTNSWSGIGFAMLPDWGLVGVDFDGCVHNGKVDPEIFDLVGTTYAEVSPSGNGVRAFFKGSLPDRKDHETSERFGMEVFCSKGFLTITGNQLDHVELLGATAEPLSPAISAEYTKRFAPRDNTPTEEASGDLTEARLLLKRLSPDCSYADWLSIGMALHYQCHGAADGLALWNEWSRPSSKYPPDGFQVLASKWASFGKYSDKPVTINTLRKLAGLPAEAFSELDPTKFQVRKFSEFADRPPLQWFVKQVVPKAGLGVVFGESGSGKTFFITDLALAIAQALQWREHRTNKGRVTYVCAEGFNGFLNRLRAYSIAHNIDLNAIDFGIVADVPNLLKLDHMQLAEQIKAFGGTDIIVIDTFAQVTPGANENGAEDMGKALSHCRELHEATGAMVLLVHHAGKDASKGARGWSGIKAAADVEIEITRKGDARCARVSKLKDSEDGAEYWFSLRQVQLGVDSDGDIVTSCVLEPAEKPAEPSEGDGEGGAAEEVSGRSNKPRGVWETMVYRLVSTLGGGVGLAVPCAEVTKEALAQSPTPEGRDRRPEQVARAMACLVEKGCVLIRDDKIWVNMQDFA